MPLRLCDMLGRKGSISSLSEGLICEEKLKKVLCWE